MNKETFTFNKFKYTKTTRFNRKKIGRKFLQQKQPMKIMRMAQWKIRTIYTYKYLYIVHKMIYATPPKIIIIKCITWECTDKYRVIYPQYLIVFVIYCCQWEWVSVYAYVLFPSQQNNYQTAKAPPQNEIPSYKIHLCIRCGTLCSVLNIILYGIGCTLYIYVRYACARICVNA